MEHHFKELFLQLSVGMDNIHTLICTQSVQGENEIPNGRQQGDNPCNDIPHFDGKNVKD